jgi:hypothetical protein
LGWPRQLKNNCFIKKLYLVRLDWPVVDLLRWGGPTKVALLGVVKVGNVQAMVGWPMIGIGWLADD